jgi:hypothetical protein
MRTYVFDLILPRFGGVLGDPVNLSLAAGGCAAVWSWRCLHRDNPWRGLLLCLGLLGAIVIAFGKGGPVLFVMALAAMWVLGKSLEGWIWKAPCLVVAGWMMIAGKVAVMDGFVRSTLPSAGTHATSILSIGSDGDVVALLLGHGIGTSGAFSVILGGLPYAESVARGAESAVASLVWQLGFLGVAATLAALGVLARSLSAMGLAAVPLVGVSVALLIQGMIQENAFAAAVWFAPLAVAAAGIAGSGAGMPSTNRATS